MTDQHLTDLEVTLLAAGVGEPPERQRLLDHIARCADCRTKLTSVVADGRALAPAPAEPSPSDAETTVIPAPMLAHLLRRAEALGAIVERTNMGASRMRLLPLGPDLGGLVPLAASSAMDEESRPPTLTSSDGSLLVNFRRPGPGGAFRAYVIRAGKEPRARLRLAFPARGQTFVVNERGEADLPGIELEDLREGQILIELSDLAAGAEPGEPAP